MQHDVVQCPKCNSNVIPCLDRLGRPVVAMGREKWMCERHEDADNPCSFVALRNPVAAKLQMSCPHCGCAHLLDDKVTHSQIVGTTRRRRRICRACGLPVFTREVVESLG